MKRIHKLSSVLRGLALGAAVLASAPLANAAGENFTTNTTTGGTYSWDGPNWSASGIGSYNSHYIPGSFPRFGGPGNYTVTCSAIESMAGMFQAASGALTITNLGTGGLSIVANGATLTQNGFSWLTQGFLVASGATISLTAPIGGAGGVEQEYYNGLATLQLYGTNTYTGGTLITSSSIYLDFNNNSSFGASTSQIGFDGTAFAIMNNTGSTSVNIPNPVQTIGQTGVDFIGNGCTYSGNWYLGGAAYNVNLRNNGVATTVTLGGVLSATTGNVTYSGANSGSILLSGANTYTGTTIVGSSGDASITFEVAATGSLASAVITNYGGTIKLDGATCLRTNANLQLVASPAAGSINLNFSGTQSIAGLYLGGVFQPGGTYGSSTSGATYQLAAFTGNGVLSTPVSPNIGQQPSSEAALNGGSATFSVTVTGAAPLAYQWYFNNSAIIGANNSSYTISPATSNNIGSYEVIITNSVGSITSSVVPLSLVETNFYTQTIVGDGAIAYYRLDETNGTVAHDVINGYNGTYTNVSLDQPGWFSPCDTDPGIGLPASTNSRGYVNVPLPANGAFNFTSVNSPFTLEGWAYFTNLTGVQRLFSTLGNANGWAFGINGSTGLRFTQGGVQDADLTLSNANVLVTGVWYYLAVTCDGFSTYTYYINGNQVGTVAIGGVGVPNNGAGYPATSPLALGADPVQYPFTAEQVYGYLDEMAIYAQSLSPTQILARGSSSRYPVGGFGGCGGLSVPPVGTPIANPATNYAGLSSTIQAVAAGQLLSYQWYQTPNTLLSGQTNSTLTISPLVSTASYYVNVSNPAGSTNSPSVTVTVLPIPTNYTDLNLTNALVLHLPFDGNPTDTSGRGNNGTNMGSPSYVSPGVVGASALHYSSAPGSFNYVKLGVKPDLQFGATTNFSVSFWVREASGAVITNLPFFSDGITGSGAGFDFNPYATSATSGGGWQWSLNALASPSAFNPTLEASDVNLINDGNWHHLAFVADRSATLTTYLDGSQVDVQSISFLNSIDTGTNAMVGQDASGSYPVTAAADIDDLGVWQRTLSPLEVTGIYLAGILNGVSFAPAPPTTVYEPLTVQVVSGQVQLWWSGTANLQGSTNASGTYTNIPGATAPYTVTSPSTQMFYRLHP